MMNPEQIHKSINSPFSCVYIKDFFDEQTSKECIECFPDASLSREFADPGVKKNINEGHGESFKRVLVGPFKDLYAWTKGPGFVTVCKSLFHDLERANVFGTKFEFSFLPGDGGCVYPHPDTPRKLATAVIYFPQKDWVDAYGGGMDMYRHKTDTRSDFSYWRERTWDNVDVVNSFPYIQNAAVFMRRSGVSLHGVRPCAGPAGSWRRSVTINLLGGV